MTVSSLNEDRKKHILLRYVGILCLAVACLGIGAIMSLKILSRQADILRGGPFYFAEVALMPSPERPYNPISVTEAQRREASGEKPYYISYYDDEGHLLSLEKRLGKKTFSRIVYTYEKGKILTREVLK